MPVMLSLPDVLADAHRYREFVADSPLVAVALHRLLLAVLHRAYMGPRSPEEWHVLWNSGQFDASRVHAYLHDPRWHAHFDLFDANRPFYQVPMMPETEPVSAAKLSIERASGNNITLFDHTTGDTIALATAEAARYLVAFQLYAASGGVNQPFNFTDGPLARDYTVLVRGRTLFETLMLNLLRYDDNMSPFEGTLTEDSPWWERERDPAPEREGTAPRGYCDYLTWQSRRVHLLYDEASSDIRVCQVRQNLKLSPLFLASDPFKAYRQDATRGQVSRRLNAEKAVWRDSHALLEDSRNDGSRPEIFQWLALLFPGRRLQPTRAFAFEVIGYLTDGPTGPVILWRRERLPLPFTYLAPESKGLRDELHSGLETAERVSRLFGTGSITVEQKSGKLTPQHSPVWVLAKELLTMSPARTPDKKDIAAIASHFTAERSYWAALEPPFRRFMLALAAPPSGSQTPDEHNDSVLAAWIEEIRGIANRTFRGLVDALESDARTLRAAALAQRQFNWLLRTLLPAHESDATSAETPQSMEVHV